LKWKEQGLKSIGNLRPAALCDKAGLPPTIPAARERARLVPGRTTLLRQDGRRLDLHLGPVLHERAYLYRAHRRVVRADDLPESRADGPAGVEVLALVGHVPGDADDVLGLAAGFGEDRHHVLQCLSGLLHDVVAVEASFA